MRSKSDVEMNSPSRVYEPLLPSVEDYLKVYHFGGTIKRADKLTFSKMIFRATRGKAYAYFFDMKID
jgi:hypothetical protein